VAFSIIAFPFLCRAARLKRAVFFNFKPPSGFSHSALGVPGRFACEARYAELLLFIGFGELCSLYIDPFPVYGLCVLDLHGCERGWVPPVETSEMGPRGQKKMDCESMLGYGICRAC